MRTSLPSGRRGSIGAVTTLIRAQAFADFDAAIATYWGRRSIGLVIDDQLAARVASEWRRLRQIHKAWLAATRPASRRLLGDRSGRWIAACSALEGSPCEKTRIGQRCETRSAPKSLVESLFGASDTARYSAPQTLDQTLDFSFERPCFPRESAENRSQDQESVVLGSSPGTPALVETV